jgi:hypothetical protein
MRLAGPPTLVEQQQVPEPTLVVILAEEEVLRPTALELVERRQGLQPTAVVPSTLPKW